MAAQNYDGDDHNQAEPRHNATRTRQRRGGRGSEGQPARQVRDPRGLPQDQQLFEISQAHLDAENIAGYPGLPLPEILPAPPPTGYPPRTGSSSISEDFAWAPQHVRTRSSYAPPSHHRQVSSLYRPNAPPHHARDQSASDFYFLQSPHISPNLSQGAFDPLALGQANLPRLEHARGMSYEAPPSASSSRHIRGGSVSKRSPTKSHRRTRTSGSQSGSLAAASAPGFPGPLVARPATTTTTSSSRMTPPPMHSQGVPRSDSELPDMRQTSMSHNPADGFADASSTAHPSLPHPLTQQAAPMPSETGEPVPILQTGNNLAAFSEYPAESRSPGMWQEPTASSHRGNSREPERKSRSESPEKKSRVRGRSRQSRPASRDTDVPGHYGPHSSSPSVLTAMNPMSDYNYSSQGQQFHGLGIGIERTAGPSTSAQPLTPILASPQMSSDFGTATSGYLGDLAVSQQPAPHMPPPGPSLHPEPHTIDRSGAYLESTPMLGSMPFLPAYVSYEQHLQRQRELEQQEQQYQHSPRIPEQGYWRDEMVQQEYWGAQGYERAPIAGTSSNPNVLESYPLEDPAHPAQPVWAADFPFSGSAPPWSRQSEGGITSIRSFPEPLHEQSPLPTVSETGYSREANAEELALEVPGPHYDETAKMNWSIEDMEELLRLLEPAEKYKWRYMSDILTETRKKRIPLRTCQNKFHALFGETESSSKLHSSLFYVAYRSGWDSIRESRTMREREAMAKSPSTKPDSKTVSESLPVEQQPDAEKGPERAEEGQNK